MNHTQSEEISTGEVYRYSPLRARMLDSGLRRVLQNPKKILGGYIRPGMTIIDIGCGPGMFTRAMAEMTGEGGKVIACDIQSEMLRFAEEKCRKAGLSTRIVWHQSTPDALGIAAEADFILSFHMVHEVPDRKRFLYEVFFLLRTGGKYLIAEPAGHVSESAFEQTIADAIQAGFRIVERPRISMSRVVLLEKPVPAGVNGDK